MITKMVSARVPGAVYDQASVLLSELGASTSELINAAFNYLLREKKLPENTAKESTSTVRKLTKEQVAELQQKLDACCISSASIPLDVDYIKKVAQEARIAKYEALD